MIRNHMLDPESTPPKNAFNQSASSGMNDDPWYTNSGPSSPVGNAMSNQGFYHASQANHTAGDWSNPMNSFVSTPGTTEEYEDFDNEPPLLEELGIRFDHIWSKTQAVLYVNKVCYIISVY